MTTQSTRIARPALFNGTAIGLALAAAIVLAPNVAAASASDCGPTGCSDELRGADHRTQLSAPDARPGDAPTVKVGTGFRITVDGAAPGGAAGSDDAARKADVALAQSGVVLQIDPLKADPVLNVVSDRGAAAPGDTVRFATFVNYPGFIARAEIRLFRPDDEPTGEPIAVVPIAAGASATWLPPAGFAGAKYVLRVYGENGRFDETEPQAIVNGTSAPAGETPREDILAENRRTKSNIAVRGASVTFRMEGVNPDDRVLIVGQPALVDRNGVAFAQLILPPGRHDIEIVIERRGGATSRIVRTVEIPDNDEFYVVQAEITAGSQNSDRDGSLSDTPDSDPDDDYVDGRIAFYYNGLFGHDWRLVASADTQEGPVEDLFTNFTRKDSRSLLRRLDPDLSWPVFGDDSTITDDAPTSGKFYVRVQNGDSHVLWGDFQTALTGTDLANYSRSLYGAQLQYRSEEQTSFGEAVARIDAFGANPGTAPARDEFRGTGGSIYFLRRQDVTQGSERVFVEVRDKDSGLVKSRHELQPARDYDLNYLQGRVFLREPLNSTAANSSLVRDGSISGDPVYLVVSYEFSPGLTAPESWVYGARAEGWLSDMIQVGATGYHDGSDGAKQTVVAADVTVRFAAGTYIRGEIARSDGAGAGEVLSGTGGYDFTLVRPLPRKATAKRIEAAVDLSDVLDDVEGRMSLYWQNREAGFSAPGQIAVNGDETQFGAAAAVTVSKRLKFTLEADSRDNEYEKRTVIEGGAEIGFSGGTYISLGARHDDRTDNGGASLLPNLSPTLNEEGARTDVSFTLGMRQPAAGEAAATESNWDVYAFGQVSLSRDDGRRRNNRYGVGGALRIAEGTKLDAEISDGDTGFGARLGFNQQVDDDTSIYLSYLLAAENPDAWDTSRQGRLTGGVKRRYSDTLNVFAEGRYVHGSGPTGFTQNYGVAFAPSERWSFDAGYETGTLSEPTSGDIERDAISGSAHYGDDTARASLTLEYRNDKSAQSGSREVFAWRAMVAADLGEDWRVFAKVNGADTQGTADASLEADFIEASLGAAYRPVANDRWNALFKYTYLADLPSPAQVTGADLSIDFAQRGHIAAADVTYDVNDWLTVGAKVAWKNAELRPSRDASAPWFSQSSTFAAIRVDAEIIEDWSVMAEYRMLDVTDIDTRSGGLVAIYYKVDANLRVGAGYNFTDFSDDLTETSYEEEGFFFNLIAAF